MSFLSSIMLASVMLYWHWEAMLISNLATRVIVLPFNNIPELVDKTSFKIALNPGSSYEDAFKYATEESWKMAWKDRIEPFLPDYMGNGGNMIKFVMQDPSIALYDNFFAARCVLFSICWLTNMSKKLFSVLFQNTWIVRLLRFLQNTTLSHMHMAFRQSPLSWGCLTVTSNRWVKVVH